MFELYSSGIINTSKNTIKLGGILAIKPTGLTSFWHRRLCEASFLVSLLILTAYSWAYITGTSNTQLATIVSDGVAIAATVTALLSFALYIWVPSKHILFSSLSVYLLLATTTAWLIIDTGGILSPFIALWMLVATFSGIFGWRGILPLSLAIISYGVFAFLQEAVTDKDIVVILLAGVLPLVMSFIIWHKKPERVSIVTSRNTSDTSEISKIASQSEAVINAIGDGLLAIDSQGIIRLINPAAQDLIGWNKRDAVSLDYKSVLQLSMAGGEELNVTTDPISQALNTNQEYRSRDLELLSSSGKKILISTVVSPIGEVGSGVILVIRDITKEKTEERQQTEFISTASHEMRTPVASIEGYLGLALNPATAQIDDKAREFIMKAHESTQHLGYLLRDLLDVSKAEDGRLASKPTLIDVVGFTQDICDGLHQKAIEKGLELVFKPARSKEGERQLSPVYYVNLDKDHLREIIDNLVENGIKYTPNGHVIVDIGGDDDNVVISIQDSGIGIPAEDIPHLFQKFYRIDNSDTREIGGTGLGLYLCRRLVESMNGRIWVESEYKRGSKFYVSVPRLSRNDVTQLQQDMEAQERQNKASQPVVTQQVVEELPQYITQPIPTPPQPQPTPQSQMPNTPISIIEQNPNLYRNSDQTSLRQRSDPAGYRNNPRT